MTISFEITETKEMKELQNAILANARETEADDKKWMSDTDKLDEYIFQCLSDFMSRKGNGDITHLRESDVWDYQVCTDDGEELYML